MSTGSDRELLRVSWPLMVGSAVAAACATGYIRLAADLALSLRVADFDESISTLIQSWRTPSLTVLFSAATWSASTLTIMALVLVALTILVSRNEVREAALISLVVASGNAIGFVAKRITERVRPTEYLAIIGVPTDYSFPSGHTLAAVLFWTTTAFVVLRVARNPWARVAVVLIGAALAILVSISRIYLGVHWPSDVAAAWLLGAGWLALTLGGFLTWERWTGSR